ncbi:hypothetical protein KO317_00625 [Candidatus Micrarchaeota archaeon]|jgi:hypothetical protein|nr:hypothetical protein [Candidatus Micrarchaeota archaeon]
MGRNFSLNVYTTVFIITLALFLTGIYIGMKLNDIYLIDFGKEVETLNVKMHSYELLFLLDNSSMGCDLYGEYAVTLDSETFSIGANLDYMEQHQGIENKELKMQYFKLEMRDYLISKKMIKQCNLNQSIILYFYSNTECILCRDQGFELDKLKHDININNQTNVRTYSFDGDYEDSAVIRALKHEFNISTYPALVINDQVYEGLRRSQEIKNKLN